LIILFVFVTSDVRAGTVLDFWHSYIPPPPSQTHYSFHLGNYKRGIFFGSCGISTKCQQWAFQFDLTGDGPVYTTDQLTLTDDNGKSLKIVSGKISIEQKQTTAIIELQIERDDVTNQFVGNGKFKIKKIH
jgi:hypothetical protein